MTDTDPKNENNETPVSPFASAPDADTDFGDCDSVDCELDTDEMVEVIRKKQDAECGDADDGCGECDDCRLCDDRCDDGSSDDGCSCGSGCCFCRYLKGIRSNIPYILFGIIVGYLLSKICLRRRH